METLQPPHQLVRCSVTLTVSSSLYLITQEFLSGVEGFKGDFTSLLARQVVITSEPGRPPLLQSHKQTTQHINVPQSCESVQVFLDAWVFLDEVCLDPQPALSQLQSHIILSSMTIPQSHMDQDFSRDSAVYRGPEQIPVHVRLRNTHSALRGAVPSP